MKKILLALIVAPMAIAFEAGAVPATPTDNQATEVQNNNGDVQLMRRPRHGGRHRVRRCYAYRNDCARIRTPIGTIRVGRCHRVCNHWGWGWATVSNLENQDMMLSAKTLDIATKYDVPADTTDAIVGSFEESKTLPSNDVIDQLATTYEVDAATVTHMIEDAVAN